MKVLFALIAGIILGYFWCFKVNVQQYEVTRTYEDGSFVACIAGEQCND